MEMANTDGKNKARQTITKTKEHTHTENKNSPKAVPATPAGTLRVPSTQGSWQHGPGDMGRYGAAKVCS